MSQSSDHLPGDAAFEKRPSCTMKLKARRREMAQAQLSCNQRFAQASLWVHNTITQNGICSDTACPPRPLAHRETSEPVACHSIKGTDSNSAYESSPPACHRFQERHTVTALTERAAPFHNSEESAGNTRKAPHCNLKQNSQGKAAIFKLQKAANSEAHVSSSWSQVKQGNEEHVKRENRTRGWHSLENIRSGNSQ